MIDREKVTQGLLHHTTLTPCVGCPYDDENPHCFQRLAEDAIALLKAQEPRVMTLDEVRRDHDRVLWIECDESKTQSVGQYRGQVCWHDRHIGKWERFVIVGFANDYLHRESEKYGKTWRCWTSRPSPEQMRETPWEEDNETV